MTGRAPWIVAGIVSAFAACLVAAAVLGSRAAEWGAAACLAVASAALVAAMKPATVTTVHEPYRPRTARPRAYPRFDHLRSMLGHALDDRRSFDRVLAPLLRDLAVDAAVRGPSTDAAHQLRAAVGEQLWTLLDPDRLPVNARDELAPPAPHEMADLLDRLEHQERQWS